MPLAAVRRRLPESALLLVTLLAASGWLFSKAVLRDLPPLLFMAIRFGLSAMVLAGLVRRRQRWQPGVWRPALRGGLLLGLAMMCWVYGLSLSQHVGVAAFISSLGIVLAPFAARLWLGTALSRRAWLGMGVAMAGMACLSWRPGGALAAAESWLLLAAAGQAAYLAVNSRDMAAMPVLQATAWQLLVAGAACLAASALLERWQGLAWQACWPPLLGSVLLATCVRFVLQGWGQGRLGVAQASFILLLEPVWTALLAAWWYGSGFSLQQGSGAALVLLALLLTRRN